MNVYVFPMYSSHWICRGSVWGFHSYVSFLFFSCALREMRYSSLNRCRNSPAGCIVASHAIENVLVCFWLYIVTINSVFWLCFMWQPSLLIALSLYSWLKHDFTAVHARVAHVVSAHGGFTHQSCWCNHIRGTWIWREAWIYQVGATQDDV